MTEIGILKLRRDRGIERLAREISSAARYADRLLRRGDWIVEYENGLPARMFWVSPDTIRRAMERDNQKEAR